MGQVSSAIKNYHATVECSMKERVTSIAFAAIVEGGDQLMTVRELILLGLDPYSLLNDVARVGGRIDPRAAKYARNVEPWHFQWTKQLYMPAHRILEASGFNKRFDPPVTISRRLEY